MNVFSLLEGSESKKHEIKSLKRNRFSLHSNVSHSFETSAKKMRLSDGLQTQKQTPSFADLGENIGLYILNMLVFPFHADSPYFSNSKQFIGKFKNSVRPVLLFKNIQLHNSFKKKLISAAHLKVKLNHHCFQCGVTNVFATMSENEFMRLCDSSTEKYPFTMNIKLQRAEVYDCVKSITKLVKSTRSQNFRIKTAIGCDFKLASELKSTGVSTMIEEGMNQHQFFSELNKSIETKWLLDNGELKSWKTYIANLIHSKTISLLGPRHKFVIFADFCHYELLQAIELWIENEVTQELIININFKKHSALVGQLSKFAKLISQSKSKIHFDICIDFEFSSLSSSLDANDFLIFVEQIFLHNLPIRNRLFVNIGPTGCRDLNVFARIGDWNRNISSAIIQKMEKCVCYVGCRNNEMEENEQTEIYLNDVIMMLTMPWKSVVVGVEENSSNDESFYWIDEKSVKLMDHQAIDHSDLFYCDLKTKHVLIPEVNHIVLEKLMNYRGIVIETFCESVRLPLSLLQHKDLSCFNFTALAKLDVVFVYHYTKATEFLKFVRICDRFHQFSIATDPSSLSEVVSLLPNELLQMMTIDQSEWRCIIRFQTNTVKK